MATVLLEADAVLVMDVSSLAAAKEGALGGFYSVELGDGKVGTPPPHYWCAARVFGKRT